MVVENDALMNSNHLCIGLYMLDITKIGFLGSGKEHMQTYDLEIHTHLNVPYVDVGNIKHRRGQAIHE